MAAPIVIDHSRPPPLLCPASALTGELHFRTGDTTGAGRITIRLTERRVCQLPGILNVYNGPDPRWDLGIRLLDAHGRTVATAADPLDAFPTNPPAYELIQIRRNHAATMPVSYCGDGTPSRAVIRYDNAIYGDRQAKSLIVPVTGTSECTSPRRFTYGPFSTASKPMVLPPTRWKQLHAELDLPERIHGKFTFRVRLTNRGEAPVRLKPCPAGTLVMGGPSVGAWDTPIPMRCIRDAVIAPHGTMTITGESGMSGMPQGHYVGRFAVAGSNTTKDTTTYRKAG